MIAFSHLPNLRASLHALVLGYCISGQLLPAANHFSIQECIIRVDPSRSVPLAMIEPAPEFVQISQWLNSDPLQLEKLKGKVVLVEFWTYSCVNCLRQIPYLTHWYNTYKDKDFVLISIHTPEYSFENDAENVKRAVKRYGITYPVAIDNSFGTWRAYKNRFWPTSYLIDKNGIIRKKQIGEGNYLTTENAIRQLLDLPRLETKQGELSRFRVITPEIHLGYAGADNYTSQIRLEPNQLTSYRYNNRLSPNQVGLQGLWRSGRECITSGSTTSKIDLNFIAGRVYAVLSGFSNEAISILLDGAPLPKSYYTQDMDDNGKIMIENDRKYDIIDLRGSIERHTLTMIVPTGISVYEFSFGLEE